ncbi:hypothetical protein BKA65DRAFT_600962 [Rhexocercosporidium sp. MPI-PUGE-AT-0058]|nr:hypothetical protein BKA65DRAFT_600962 [Rhexocercosporidium sp. MPI-PUGE-AT-0058]
MLERYFKNMPEADSKYSPSPAAGQWTFLLSGTTGSLGSHLLAALDGLPKTKIGKIICLNRSADAKEKQKKLNLSRAIKASWQDYDVPKVDAWQVDFNLSIDSFEPQICGVRNLLDFSFKSPNKAPLMFVSSISTALHWMDSHTSAKVLEAVILDFDAPEHIDYGESKFVSEHLLHRFTAASGITTAVLRTGQIDGSVSDSGIWNKKEWLPSIIASSKYLGILPESLQ